MRKSYAVITGASSGIGAEFARRFAMQGFRLVLAARREDRLQELKQELEEIYHACGYDVTEESEPILVPVDLSAREGCDQLVNRVEALPVRIFINNAGFGDCGTFLTTDVEKELSMIDVNVKALHYLTKCMLQKMRTEKNAYILNVASSAGLLPAGPYMATYYATKAYVTSLTSAIARELEEAGSTVYLGALCPGPVDTEFNDVANVEFALPGISVDFCVNEAIRGMKKRQTIIVPGRQLSAVMKCSHVLPRKMLTAIAGHQQKKKLEEFR